MKRNQIISTAIFLLMLSGNVFGQEFKKQLKSGELKVAYFASGCFWCVEAIYESVKGVEEAVSGYSGGHTKNPTYRSTGTGNTGHAETVAVYYRPDVVSFEELLEVYFGSQDATTYGQNPDFGSQYRSIIFYQTAKEKQQAKNMFSILNTSVYKGKMVTEIVAFEKFYKAEDYHQNYEKLHPNNGYVKNVSIPRLNRFKSAYPELLKEKDEQ
ncbi:peptide-methionine (S)-S-oxide reductase MsrA [Flavicella marina]|uniref:peptide-methionine (S)-S-oxide reductase MsrA n=1 Tax=Flavicella marina TaxID=1475951 RepID=UPI00126555ED